MRFWRQEQRMSQLELSLEAQVSTRHLSCVETGRARASRDLLMHLCRTLRVPEADQQRLLVAAGYAPAPITRVVDPTRLRELQAVVDAHEPMPALICDPTTDIVCANQAAELLWRDVTPELLEEPLNLLQLATHPQGLPRVSTVSASCSASLAQRLRRGHQAVASPLAGFTLRTRAGPVVLRTVIAWLGEPSDFDVQPLALETFLPADSRSADRLRELAESA